MEIFRDFDDAWSHKDRCSMRPPVIISGKRAGGRSRGRVGNAVNTSYGAYTEVADTINNDDDIFIIIFSRKYAARGRKGSGVKAKDKSGFIRVGM